MIRASIFALSLLIATPTLAAPTHDGHTHEKPDYVLSEAPNDHVLGNADAADTLIIYASNVCPHCGNWFANDWPIVKSELVETGKLRFVFRPLASQPVSLSETGFMMAECADEENYMSVIEYQFARQPIILEAAYKKDGQMIQTQYDAIAAAAGLTDNASIAACLNTKAHFDTIQTAGRRASAAGISNIPSFIFNGQVMNGAHDAAAIKGWVEGRSSIRR